MATFPFFHNIETKLTTDRVQKLKDARTEAAKEIEEYKAQKEADFKRFESDVSNFAEFNPRLRTWVLVLLNDLLTLDSSSCSSPTSCLSASRVLLESNTTDQQRLFLFLNSS
jgi:hypothetical protein